MTPFVSMDMPNEIQPRFDNDRTQHDVTAFGNLSDFVLSLKTVLQVVNMQSLTVSLFLLAFR